MRDEQISSVKISNEKQLNDLRSLLEMVYIIVTTKALNMAKDRNETVVVLR
jgi:hypothetical protein